MKDIIFLGLEERDDVTMFQEARRACTSPVAGGGMMSKGDQGDREGKRGLYRDETGERVENKAMQIYLGER